jgi:hypothetical protein
MFVIGISVVPVRNEFPSCIHTIVLGVSVLIANEPIENVEWSHI